ncbi:AI-2E family transporter [uncultured Rikenella sp.]|uniref:AI-2E family transporter n=1 Tax=uncultured Rikenella sp. TaxID=368003 RepID=UPI00262F1178|nr:AI-2E family transporter [uncultured Rikenella sp.]
MSPIYRWIAAGAGLLAAGFLVWYFQTIVFYILIAAVLSLMGKPLVTLLCRVRIKERNMPKWAAAMVTLIVMLVVIYALAVTLVPVVLDKIDQLASFDIDRLTSALAEPISRIEEFINRFLPDNNFSVREYIHTQVGPMIASIDLGRSLASVTGWVVDLVIGVFSISFITYFFLKDDRLFFDGVVILFPAKYEANITRALDSATTLLIRYFIGICIEMLIKLLCITLPLYLFGLEFNTALVIGAISAVLNVIPYIGPLIGAFAGCVIALLSTGPGIATGTLLLQMVIVFAVFQLIDNIILQPYIYSSSVRAHPLEIFIVILMAGYIAGVLGMLLAIPAYTVIRVFAKEFFNHFRVVRKLTENI